MLHALTPRPPAGWSARGLFILAFTVLVSCASDPHPIAFSPLADEPRPHRLFAVSHGWHVGLVLPAAPLVAHLPALKERFAKAGHLEIGWGDKGFYQSENIAASQALQAMFASTGAVMHVVSLPPSTDLPFDTFRASEVLQFCASDRELASLNAFVAQSFVKSTDSQLVATKPGIYGDSQFYEAIGKYHMLNTCNTWVAKGLASMGIGVEPALALTAGNVMRQLLSIGRVVRTGATAAAGLAGGLCR